jgi:lipopolysaccharide transport system permease protein
MQWDFILPGSVVAVLVLVFGAMYFRRMERVFVDVI